VKKKSLCHLRKRLGADECGEQFGAYHMGNFYTSYTLRGPDQESVAGAVAGRAALVTPAQDKCVVVFDEESEDQNDEIVAELASRLSGQFHCPLLAALNHDDSVLWYQLYLSGELVDEYHSAPGYFETEDEEASMAGPEGGDAAKLCHAFGSAAIRQVEKILRAPSAEESGYVFAVERHMDLMSELGIPGFGASGFNQIKEGELPDGLTEGDLVNTKDLSPSPPLEDTWRRPVPGYYKVSFRAHPKLTKSIPSAWMPASWSELECREQDLSEAFRKATAGYRETFQRLGFVEFGFKKLKGVLNPNSRDGGGINYLDSTRCHFGQIIYNRAYMPSMHSEKENVVVAFTAVFPVEDFSCTNHVDFLEPVPNKNVIRLKSNDAAFIYEKFLEHLKGRTDSPRQFPDLQSLQAWFDSNTRATFEFRVRRGAWVRMSDYEVEKARKQIEK
jgi:hypothetical protein